MTSHTTRPFQVRVALTDSAHLVIPKHLGIIMDGNGRWAQARGLSRTIGHQAGLDNLQRVLQACVKHGIEVLSVYAFSTENWHRPPEEVAGMMHLISVAVQRDLDELHRNGVKIVHSGRLQELEPALQQELMAAVEVTRDNTRIILNVAVNYGGRSELLDAARQIMEAGIEADDVSEALINRHLYAPDLPDLDLVIRTSGEHRLSNFLLWQAAHAEFYATPTHWPDFDEVELDRALAEYSMRMQRRNSRVATAETVRAPAQPALKRSEQRQRVTHPAGVTREQSTMASTFT